MIIQSLQYQRRKNLIQEERKLKTHKNFFVKKILSIP